jgi:glyoxylase-like metal-dependent hydrolase (beta-lactamase superfamily II)
MKLFINYCPFGFSNCYILGSDTAKPGQEEEAAPREAGLQEAALSVSTPQEAIIIDPGNMDGPILNFIEKNNYYLRAVLITHDHLNHVHGLKTIKRIYDVEIYAVNRIIQEYRTVLVKDGETLNLGPFQIEVITVPGHSADSAVFKIGHMLFTGDTITAGLLGSTVSSYGATIQLSSIRSKILSLPGNYTILPGHGPPSSLDAERRFNAGIQYYEQHKNRRPVFTVELDN